MADPNINTRSEQERRNAKKDSIMVRGACMEGLEKLNRVKTVGPDEDPSRGEREGDYVVSCTQDRQEF
jgi:hypothetical protein